MSVARVAILGAGGQLGQAFVRRLPDATRWTRAEVDVTQPDEVRAAIEAARPDVVLNCTSCNQVDAAERDPGPVFAVNAHAVGALARLCAERGVRLAHFSTNYVFGRDETRKIPYAESDAPEPRTTYGVSKFAGEELVRLSGAASLVIRTAALFGPATGVRHNFLDNMLAKAQSGETVRIVADQTVAPTATDDLVAATLALLERGAEGTFHVNGPDAATWHDLARAYLDRFGLGDRVVPTTSAALAAPAQRPRFSVLAIDKYLATGGPAPRPWREAVAAYCSSRISTAK